MAEATEVVKVDSPNPTKEANPEKDEANDRTDRELKPWEQHSAVISMPRFNYRAPSSLLHSSHSGFLITCPIKREKSATKEAISILEKHIGRLDSCVRDSEGIDVNFSPKRRKLCSENADSGCGGTADECLGAEYDANMTKTDALSLVKLTRSGLVLLLLRDDFPSSVTDVVSNIIMSLESKTLATPNWCHRIFPIQATCSLKEKEVHTIVSRLAKKFMSNNRRELSEPLKFAVGYNRRGIEETEMKHKRSASTESGAFDLLDRSKCFSVVAAAIKEAIPNSVVDLKCPMICILLEVLPLSTISDGSMVVAVSVLPQNLVSLKPKLGIKSLISDTKVKNKN